MGSGRGRHAPGDPRFTPKPTTKPRRDLLSIDRGPHVPMVWLDRATMTPVKYAGEKPQSPPVDWMPDEIDEPRAEESGDQRARCRQIASQAERHGTPHGPAF